MLPNIPKIQEFGQGIASIEYNADWIGTSTFYTKSKFGDGFEICSIIGLRKNDVAEAYIFFMVKNKNKELPLISPSSDCLKFK